MTFPFITINQSTHLLYISLKNSIVVVNAIDGKVVGTIVVNGMPRSISIDEARNKLYVVIENSAAEKIGIFSIDCNTNNITPIAGEFDKFDDSEMHINSDTNMVYALNRVEYYAGEGTTDFLFALYLIDGNTNRIVRGINLRNEYRDIFIDKTRNNVILVRGDKGQIVVLNQLINQVIEVININSDISSTLCYNPPLQKLYFTETTLTLTNKLLSVKLEID